MQHSALLPILVSPLPSECVLVVENTYKTISTEYGEHCKVNQIINITPFTIGSEGGLLVEMVYCPSIQQSQILHSRSLSISVMVLLAADWGLVAHNATSPPLPAYRDPLSRIVNDGRIGID